MTSSASLNAARREEELERLAAGEAVDVLVVGGGISGVGVALDAASRGLSVVLLERRDLAFGTSRWSSKLIHGGLRYLAHGDFGLAWESARERGVLMGTIAPHLVRPLPFLVPLTPQLPAPQGALVELGTRIGNTLRVASGTGRRTLPRPRRITAVEAQRLAPALNSDGLRGAILHWDGQLEDDARLVIAVARTAAAHGARIITYCTVTELRSDVAYARDELTGQALELRARHVVNATGVWAGDLEPRVCLEPSKGAHVIMPSALLGHPQAALTVPVSGEKGRWVFAVPTGDSLITIGVTDERYREHERDAPAVNADDVSALLQAINRPLVCKLEARQMIGQFAGLRPLVAGHSGATADLSRRHLVIENPDTGTLTLIGGKLTTYRAMAQDVVDRIVARPSVSARPCRTTKLPLIGAGDPLTLQAIDAPERLVRRYGTEAPILNRMAIQDPQLLQPIADSVPVLGVELVFAIEHELALTLDDLLDRRTRIGLVPADREAASAPAAAIFARTTPAGAGCLPVHGGKAATAVPARVAT